MAIDITGFFRPEILEMGAYHVQDASGMIKLDAMENPYSWPDEMKGGWLASLEGYSPNRYPDPQANNLRPLLMRSNQVPSGVGMLLGNGSDEIIQLLLMAMDKKASVLAPEPTFVMYRQLAKILGIEFIGVPLNPADFSLDMSAMEEAIEQHKPQLVFLAYPNNPTGNLFSREDIERVIKITSGLVVVDEAYTPFARDSFMSDIPRYPNLMVMRTLSKLGLAGLRLGFLCAAQEWIHQLEKLRLPYNINSLSQFTAAFALQHEQILTAQTQAICRDRQKLALALSELKGVTPYPSEANFITFRCPDGAADRLFSGMRDLGVLIKNLNSVGGMLTNCLRVTIGAPLENDAFINALKKTLS